MGEGGGDGLVQDVVAVCEGYHNEADHEEHTASDHASGLGHLGPGGFVEIYSIQIGLDEHLFKYRNQFVGHEAPYERDEGHPWQGEKHLKTDQIYQNSKSLKFIIFLFVKVT